MAHKAPSPDIEIWKDIPEWEGRYQASSLGRIRSVPRFKRHKSRNGEWFDMPLKGRVLRPGTHENGYKIVALSDLATGRKPRTFRVHRLVCLAFHGAPTGERQEVAHGNGVRDDNRAANLRWATRAENFADMKRHREQVSRLG